jgi:hypothetical protein
VTDITNQLLAKLGDPYTRLLQGDDATALEAQEEGKVRPVLLQYHFNYDHVLKGGSGLLRGGGCGGGRRARRGHSVPGQACHNTSVLL